MKLRGRGSVAALTCCLLACISGCTTVGYYFQAIEGHLEVMRRSAPFSEVIANAGNNEALRLQLSKVEAIRQFASRELALPDNGSYRRYADLGRSYVVWNVFAAPEFSVRPAESCFPVAGCVPYRGFYDEGKARAYALELAGRGLDTYVGGVLAYSTLGWFDDPVLSTFVGLPEAELARIIFHELAHQVAYVRGDAKFNESFAVAVEQFGVRRWLASRHARAAEEMQRWESGQSRRREFLALLIRHRDALVRIYEHPASDAEKRLLKSSQFMALRRDYESLKENWGGFSGYDRFLAQGLNNALLASVAVYTDHVPVFAALIEGHQGNLEAFYADVQRMAAMSASERDKTLQVISGALAANLPINGIVFAR